MAWFRRRRKKTEATALADQGATPVRPARIRFLSDPGRWIASKARAVMRSVRKPDDDLQISLRLGEDLGNSRDEIERRD